MRRVWAGALGLGDDGALRFDGEVFSGLALRVDQAGIVEAIEIVEAGHVVGASEDWLPLPEGGTRVVRAALQMESDYGPLLFDGEPITGVVYWFGAGHVCELEQVVVRGLPIDEGRRSWYPSGSPMQLIRGEDGFSWFEDGRLESRRVGMDTLLNVVVNDGRLTALVLGDAGLFDLTTVGRTPFASELVLVGAAIDAPLLATLRERAGLYAVERLRLVETGAGPEVADVLGSLPALTTLWLQANTGLDAAAVERLRAALPRCVVHHDAYSRVVGRSTRS